jgi:type IV secretion system protein VirD4
MKIKMNNAVGPQVRSAKPKQSKLLPALGSRSRWRRPASRHSVLCPHLQLPANPGGPYRAMSMRPGPFWNGPTSGTPTIPTRSCGRAASACWWRPWACSAWPSPRWLPRTASKANEYLHGSARWAEKKDIEAAGLLPRERSLLDVVTGKEAHPPLQASMSAAGRTRTGNFYYLRHNGPEHILTYAPTRSGKGVGLVVPTLLSWPASAVITDLKGELWT